MDLPLWVYWEGKQTDAIDMCLESIQRHNPGRFRLVCRDWIEERRAEDKDERSTDLSRLHHPCQRADYYRVWLLKRYGGMWVDADTICMKPLDWFFDQLNHFDCVIPTEILGHGQYMFEFVAARRGSMAMRYVNEIQKALVRQETNKRIKKFRDVIGPRPFKHGITRASYERHPCLALDTSLVHPIFVRDEHRKVNVEAYKVERTDEEHALYFDENAWCYGLRMRILMGCGVAPRETILGHPSFLGYLFRRSYSREDRPHVRHQPGSPTRPMGSVHGKDPKHMALPAPERWSATDGKATGWPRWWTQGAGAWGCFMSHLLIYEDAMHRGLDAFLVLEDDACFREGVWDQHVEAYLEALPGDWKQAYIGGQMLLKEGGCPDRVNKEVCRVHNVNRTHGYLMTSQGVKEMWAHLLDFPEWARNPRSHVDHRMGQLHQKKSFKTYAPNKWLIGQAAGQSDVCCRHCKELYWPDPTEWVGKPPPKWSPADRLKNPPPHKAQQPEYNAEPFVLVLGLHRSGSSLVGKICQVLGVHMGNKLVGYEERRGVASEAEGLAKICEHEMPFPGLVRKNQIREPLRRWLLARQSEAKEKGTVAGGKYPHLCVFGQELQEICSHYYVVNCDRHIECSIESLFCRGRGSWSRDQIQDLQCTLAEGKDWLLARTNHHTVGYEDLLDDPTTEITRLANFLPVTPTPKQIEAAISLVEKKHNHFPEEQVNRGNEREDTEVSSP